MFNKSLQYSVAAQKRERYKLLRVVFTLLIMFLLYNAIHTFLFSVWITRNDSMYPGLRTGDRLLVISSTLPFMLSNIGGNEGTLHYNRGSIVLIDKERENRRNPFLVAADSLVRFLRHSRLASSVQGNAFT